MPSGLFSAESPGPHLKFCVIQVKHRQVVEALLIRRLIFVPQTVVEGQLRSDAELILGIKAVIIIFEGDPSVALCKLRGPHIIRKTEQQIRYGIARAGDSRLVRKLVREGKRSIRCCLYLRGGAV